MALPSEKVPDRFTRRAGPSIGRGMQLECRDENEARSQRAADASARFLSAEKRAKRRTSIRARHAPV